MTTAAGMTIKELALNLSFILHPNELVAAIVVSDMKERLSPKKAPPTTIAVKKPTSNPVCSATPTAIGTSATIVPTLVPMDMEMRHVPRKKAANIMLGGKTFSASATVASTAPMLFATSENAPASINIQSMSIILLEPAPWLNVSIRFLIEPLATNAMA